MNKFKDSYNSKIDFRFLAFANMNIDQFESTFNLGKVFKGELEATTNNQIDMVKTKRSFELFKEKGINKETIMECIKTFNVVVTNTKLQMLINYINELDKSDYYEYACKLFMFIVKKSLFGAINNKMAILIFNTIMYQNNTLPIIFYPHNMRSLNELINSGLSFESLKEIIKKHFHISIVYNTPHKLITRDEIIEILLKSKSELENVYGVEHVTLAGSYVNGLYTEYSDVDLIVAMKDKDKKKEVEDYFVKKFETPVDIVLSDEEFTMTADLQKFRLGVF